MADKTQYVVNTADLTAVANAIRTKGGTSGSLSFPDGFNSAIAAIPGGTSIPKITNMTSLFIGRENLIPILLPACDDITGAEQAFYNLSNLQSADLSDIHFGAACSLSMLFGYCSSLVSVKLPEDDTYAINNFSNIFSECTNLESVDMSCLTFSSSSNYSNGGAFYDCTSLRKVALPKRGSSGGGVIGANLLYNCSALEELIVPGDSVFRIYMTTAFKNSSIETGTCFIYVPDALVDSYKAATTWSTYASQIKGFSDYPGTPWWHSGTN